MRVGAEYLGTYGVGALQATLALDYMRFVDDEIAALDADVAKLSPPPTQSFLGPWTDFLDNPAPSDEDVPRGWRAWFHDHSSLLSRLTDTDDLIHRTGEYERRYVDFYHQFEAQGGKASHSAPTEPGSPPRDLVLKDREQHDAGVDFLSNLPGNVLLLGAIGFGAVVLLQSGVLKR